MKRIWSRMKEGKLKFECVEDLQGSRAAVILPAWLLFPFLHSVGSCNHHCTFFVSLFPVPPSKECTVEFPALNNWVREEQEVGAKRERVAGTQTHLMVRVFFLFSPVYKI